jgi:hypothetical protein
LHYNVSTVLKKVKIITSPSLFATQKPFPPCQGEGCPIGQGEVFHDPVGKSQIPDFFKKSGIYLLLGLI